MLFSLIKALKVAKLSLQFALTSWTVCFAENNIGKLLGYVVSMYFFLPSPRGSCY